jgi:hypothetical protein
MQRGTADATAAISTISLTKTFLDAYSPLQADTGAAAGATRQS